MTLIALARPRRGLCGEDWQSVPGGAFIGYALIATRRSRKDGAPASAVFFSVATQQKMPIAGNTCKNRYLACSCNVVAATEINQTDE